MKKIISGKKVLTYIFNLGDESLQKAFYEAFDANIRGCFDDAIYAFPVGSDKRWVDPEKKYGKLYEVDIDRCSEALAKLGASAAEVLHMLHSGYFTPDDINEKEIYDLMRKLSGRDRALVVVEQPQGPEQP